MRVEYTITYHENGVTVAQDIQLDGAPADVLSAGQTGGARHSTLHLPARQKDFLGVDTAGGSGTSEPLGPANRGGDDTGSPDDQAGSSGEPIVILGPVIIRGRPSAQGKKRPGVE